MQHRRLKRKPKITFLLQTKKRFASIFELVTYKLRKVFLDFCRTILGVFSNLEELNTIIPAVNYIDRRETHCTEVQLHPPPPSTQGDLITALGSLLLHCSRVSVLTHEMCCVVLSVYFDTHISKSLVAAVIAQGQMTPKCSIKTVSGKLGCQTSFPKGLKKPRLAAWLSTTVKCLIFFDR